MNTSSSNAYNNQLHLLSQNSYSAHPAIDANNTTSNNNIELHNNQKLISQGVAIKEEGLITDDLTLISRTRASTVNPSDPNLAITGKNTLNDRLEMNNQLIKFTKDNPNDQVTKGTEIYNKSYNANEITPSSIVIKSKDNNTLVSIDTSDNSSGSIEIRNSNNGVIFKISSAGLIVGVPTNITQDASVVNNTFKFTPSRNHQFKIANQLYVDKRYRTDFESEFWRTVSTRLHNVDKDADITSTNTNLMSSNSVISYPAKIKEFIKKDKIPMRYEYEMIENCKMTKLGFNDNSNGSKLLLEPYEAPVFKTYKGSNYIIGTNPNWCFSFTKAKRKTILKSGIEEIVYDEHGNPTYELDSQGKLVTETIHI